jgi:hypothetical protein
VRIYKFCIAKAGKNAKYYKGFEDAAAAADGGYTAMVSHTVSWDLGELRRSYEEIIYYVACCDGKFGVVCCN